MNKDIFKSVAIEIDNIIKEKMSRLIRNMNKSEDSKVISGKIKLGLLDEKMANEIVIGVVDVYKRLLKKSEDFNTQIMVFVNLYNYLQYESIEKYDRDIMVGISELFDNEDDKEYFLDLLEALDNPNKRSFLELQYKNKEIEISYVYLAVIYIQNMLDYRTKQEDKEYDNLAYCFSKIDKWLTLYILYGSGYTFFERNKDFTLKYYRICLPYVRVRELSELAPSFCYIAVVITDKLYDEMGIIVGKMGNFIYDLEKKNTKMRNLQEERHNIIRDFSHTYENMQAIGLKEIADILLENKDTKVQQCGRVILAEYGIKNSLRAEFNLLRLNFEDNKDDIIRLISKDVYKYEKEYTVNIEEIFEDTLRISLLRIIYSGNPRGDDIIAKKIYRRLKDKVGVMTNFVMSFENDVILKGQSSIKFLKERGILIYFTSDDEWNRLYFLKNGHAEVLIRSIFSELIINFMKYSDLNKEIEIKLKFNDGKFGVLQFNRVTELIVSESGFGIVSKGKILEKINGYKSCYLEKVNNVVDDNVFKVLFLDKRLFNRE